MNQQLTVYIADDHNIVAKGVAAIIRQVPQVANLQIFNNGRDLYDACTIQLPNLIFLDMHMPVWDGRKTLVELKSKFPCLRCMMLSMNNEKEIIDDCLDKGAAGYLNKDCTEEELHEAILSNPDEVYFSKEVLKVLSGYHTAGKPRPLKLHEPLTDRELEILSLLCEGLTPREIAEKIFLSPRTVETHKKNIMEKFEVNSVSKLISVALKNNVIK